MAKEQRAITERQRQVVGLIVRGEQGGVQPTIREMVEALGIRSTNAVADHLRALERKGMLLRHGRSRSIEVTPKGYHACGVEMDVRIPMSLWKRFVDLVDHPSVAAFREVKGHVEAFEGKRARGSLQGLSPHTMH